MLKRIVLENYRSCLRTRLDLHPRLSVLIGPNGSGKTNILQGVMLLNKLGQPPERLWGRENRIAANSRITAAFRQGHTEARLAARVGVYTGDSNNDVMAYADQKWLLRHARGPRLRLGIPLSVAAHVGDKSASRRIFRLGGRVFWPGAGAPLPRMEPWATAALREVERFCLGIKYYGASQFTNPSTCPPSFEIELEGGRHGPYRLRGHARVLYDMYTASRAPRADQYKRFLETVGRGGLGLIDDIRFRGVRSSYVQYSVRIGGKVERRKRYNLLVIPQFKIGRQTLSPNQLSEGTFKTLALLFHLITDPGTALLIEEPEVCVHHGLLSSILELIKSYSGQKQIILSTHSDFVLDHVGPENVYTITMDKTHGTAANHIRQTMTAQEFQGLRQYLEREGNLGEYWREGGLG